MIPKPPKPRGLTVAILGTAFFMILIGLRTFWHPTPAAGIGWLIAAYYVVANQWIIIKARREVKRNEELLDAMADYMAASRQQAAE